MKNEFVIEKNDKISFIQIVLLTTAFAFFSGSITAGMTIAAGLQFDAAIKAAIFGNVLLAIYGGMIGFIGAKTSTATSLHVENLFGKKFKNIPNLALMITQIGWFGVGVMMIANPISEIFGINTFILIVLFGALMILSAYFGVKGLKIISIIAVPAIIIFGIMVLVGGFNHSNEFSNLVLPATTMSFSAAVGISFATFVSGATQTSDFTRYAKTGVQGALASAISFLVGNSFMVIVGIILHTAFDINQITLSFLGIGFSGWLLLTVLLNVWSTNDSGLFSASLAMSNIFNISKKKSVLIGGIIAVILAPILNEYFIGFLNIMNLTLPGIGVIIVLGYVMKVQPDSKSFMVAAIAWLTSMVIGNYIGTALDLIIPLVIIIITSIIYAIGIFITKKMNV